MGKCNQTWAGTDVDAIRALAGDLPEAHERVIVALYRKWEEAGLPSCIELSVERLAHYAEVAAHDLESILLSIARVQIPYDRNGFIGTACMLNAYEVSSGGGLRCYLTEYFTSTILAEVQREVH